MLERLNECLRPLAEIRDKQRHPPINPDEAVQSFLQWTQREFLPHLQAEQDLCRPVLTIHAAGEPLYRQMLADHRKLRELAQQAREEMLLLQNEDSIREDWWNTLDLACVWSFQRAMAEHVDCENREIFPKAIALQVKE